VAWQEAIERCDINILALSLYVDSYGQTKDNSGLE
jgi:hypothetical protein